jgi:hypothetical protein
MPSSRGTSTSAHLHSSTTPPVVSSLVVVSSPLVVSGSTVVSVSMGLVVSGLVVSGLVVSGLVVSGLVVSGLVVSGLVVETEVAVVSSAVESVPSELPVCDMPLALPVVVGVLSLSDTLVGEDVSVAGGVVLLVSLAVTVVAGSSPQATRSAVRTAGARRRVEVKAGGVMAPG